ncbi:hypothetical protein TNCV_724161 [Trichonephila clavipes]|nr:hypothetical protein TNCV_724161 [Trichonephila clavipes]
MTLASTCEFEERENGLDQYRIVPRIKDNGLQERLFRENNQVLFEGDARNRWRDGPVCPAVDKELWRLGPNGSGVFWRVMRQ